MLSRRPFHFKLSTFNRFGFSLLELLVVLAIMALLTAMSAPAISGYLKGARLKGGARQIASTLRMARQLAITNRAVYSVDFITAANQFYVNDGINVVDEIRTLPETITYSSWTITDSDSDDNLDAEFTPRGSYVGSSASISIINTAGDTRQITITNTTGRVKVQ